jgi:hypothetical protein
MIRAGVLVTNDSDKPTVTVEFGEEDLVFFLAVLTDWLSRARTGCAVVVDENLKNHMIDTSENTLKAMETMRDRLDRISGRPKE